MKILIVTQYFFPERFRINELALELKKRGHEIRVFTGKPNYPQGKIYPGYTFWGIQKEVWNELEVVRIPIIPRGHSSIGMILNYLSFWVFGNARVKMVKGFHPDIIYVFETSPITCCMPALRLKKKTGVPVIMNVQDLWPENVVAITGLKNKAILYMLERLVHKIYLNCDLLLTASRQFIPSIQRRLPQTDKEQNKVKYWPQFSTVDSNCYKAHGKREFFDIIFTGNLGEGQGLELVIEAASKMRERCVRRILVGDGRNRESLENKTKKMGLDKKILFYGNREEREIPQLLHQADVALLILKDSPIFRMTVPAKLQTYLACGMPVLGCVQGEAKKIILEAKAGIVTDEISADELIRKAQWISNVDKKQLQEYSSNGYLYGKQMFSREHLINQLEEEMRGLSNV